MNKRPQNRSLVSIIDAIDPTCSQPSLRTLCPGPYDPGSSQGVPISLQAAGLPRSQDQGASTYRIFVGKTLNPLDPIGEGVMKNISLNRWIAVAGTERSDHYRRFGSAGRNLQQHALVSPRIDQTYRSASIEKIETNRPSSANLIVSEDDAAMVVLETRIGDVVNVSFAIVDGFPASQRDEVVRLFWEAFRPKLYPVMKPEGKAIAFLQKVADPTHAISALSPDGLVIGVAGFKTAAGAFIGGGLKEMCAVYGPVGGVWRGLALSVLERPLQPGTLLMDGIFVDETARGRGVGSALLAAIKARAAMLDCSSVRLDVIDTNPRAKALYERHGFVAESTSDMGALRHVFGFRRATTMICHAPS